MSLLCCARAAAAARTQLVARLHPDTLTLLWRQPYHLGHSYSRCHAFARRPDTLASKQGLERLAAAPHRGSDPHEVCECRAAGVLSAAAAACPPPPPLPPAQPLPTRPLGSGRCAARREWEARSMWI